MPARYVMMAPMTIEAQLGWRPIPGIRVRLIMSARGLGRARKTNAHPGAAER